MNNKQKTIVIVVGIIALIALSFVASKDVKKEGYNDLAVNQPDVSDKAQQESAAVKDDERKSFTNINTDQYIDYYNGSEEVVVFYGSTNCHWCKIAEPLVQNVAFEHNLTIYYLNNAEFAEEDANKLVKLNDNVLEFGTPTILLVHDGKIHDMINGLVDRDGYENFFRKHEYIK